MNKLLLTLAIAIVVVVAISGTAIFLFELHPFDPGDFLYPVQELAEMIRYRLVFENSRRVNLALDLAFRRLEELQRMTNKEDINLAAKKFEQALDVAVIAVAQSEISEREMLIRRLNEL